MISATGSLAARRDMPVGVAGEGGQIERVLVEPGDYVQAGQTLAVINRSVQTQEAPSSPPRSRSTRADLRLAQSELDRAQALVSRGFISQADIDRKRATRDAAAARVRVAQATFGASRARIGRLDIRAPTAGLVLARNVEAGQVVGAGSAPCSGSPSAARWSCSPAWRSPISRSFRSASPVTVTPVGSNRALSRHDLADLADHRSADPPGHRLRAGPL